MNSTDEQRRRRCLLTMMAMNAIVVVVGLEMKSFAVEGDAAKLLHATTFFAWKKKSSTTFLLFCFVLKLFFGFFFCIAVHADS
jgi:hypothetical protein